MKPIVVTASLKRVRLLFRLAVVLLVLMVLMAGLLLFDGKQGHARVGPPVPGTDRVVLEVLDGGSPRSWEVDWVDGGARVGDVVEVRLRGSCDCEPFPTDGGMALVLPLLGVAICLAIITGFLGRRRRRGAIANARSVRALTSPSRPVLVSVAPAMTASRYQPQLALDLVRADTSEPLGHIVIPPPTREFDPSARFWVYGGVAPGSVVALVEESGTQVVFPASTLTAGPAPVAPWSPVAARILGWTTPSEPAPSLPSTGRISVSSFSDGAGTPALDHAMAKYVASLARFRVAFAIAYVGIVAIVFLVSPLAGIAVFPIVAAVAIAWLRGPAFMPLRSELGAATAGDLLDQPDRRDQLKRLTLAIAAYGRNVAGTPWPNPLPVPPTT